MPAFLISFLTSPRFLIGLLIVGITASGWGIAWARGKRIDSLKATVAAEQAKVAEYQSAYERLAVVVQECNRATQALETAAKEAQRKAAQESVRARALAEGYRQQAEALRNAPAPAERSCDAADALVKESLR